MKAFTRNLMLGAALSMSALVATPSFAAEEKTQPILGITSSALEEFGGREGVRAWVESLFYYIMLDNRIAPIFR